MAKANKPYSGLMPGQMKMIAEFEARQRQRAGGGVQAIQGPRGHGKPAAAPPRGHTKPPQVQPSFRRQEAPPVERQPAPGTPAPESVEALLDQEEKEVREQLEAAQAQVRAWQARARYFGVKLIILQENKEHFRQEGQEPQEGPQEPQEPQEGPQEPQEPQEGPQEPQEPPQGPRKKKGGS